MATLQGIDSGLLSAEPSAYHALRQPRKIACIDLAAGEQLTYGALAERVARASGWLDARIGDPVGARVAVLTRNCIDEVVLCLACQRSGAIFVPLNWRLTGDELAVLVADCTPAIVVASDEFAAAAVTAIKTAAVGELVPLTTFSAEAAASRPRAPAALPSSAPVTLLYTSGTTGRPKGAIVTRQGAAFSALNFAALGEADTNSVLMSDGPLFHTIALFAVLRTAMTFGATAVLSDRFEPAATLAVLDRADLGITHYFAVPQMAAVLAAQPAFATADLSRLKAIFCGGAPLPAPLVETYLARDVLLINGFGMSEAGSVMHMPLDRDVIVANPGCVGLPAPFLDARIVDADGADVADGATGELWLRGPAITPGYWNQPDANAASFAGTWFRTGDVARREINGFYRLVDRLKDMYISGGENVYPAEVEAAISTLPDVAEVAVVGVPDARWGETGIAFVVARPGRSLSEADVLGACARLARYKHPAHVRVVDRLARTASGKVVKAVLRQSWIAETENERK